MPLTAEELMLQAAELSKKAGEQLAIERHENAQRKMDDLLRRSALPSRYVNATLNQPNKWQLNAYAKAGDFVKNFAARLETGAGMLLWGDIGTGKTHLACAIANDLRKQMRPVLYCTAMEAVSLVKASWSKTAEVTEFDVYARFGDPDLLVIDEIGVQNGTEFERTVLTSIADIRSRNCLPTIVVSNLAPKEIFALIGERMFDRLVGYGADIVHMPGKSLRMVI